MVDKILIANRGEIALRIMRAARELEIPTVVVYSEADRDSLPVRLADESVCIGPASSAKSYLSVPNIISAALITNCDAIHPGYGFLSEDRYFAEICREYNLTFIGPSPEAIAKVANKALARRTMKEAGLPTLPGTDEPVTSLDDALAQADQIGYPIMLKPAAGGGGRGMRLVANEQELAQGFHLSRAEARASFGDDEIYLERYLEHCRHVEVQVLGDQHGNVIHLGERECSIQRRHQKLVEEAPCSILSGPVRRELGDAAVRGARAIGYTSAGTLEFLADDRGNFYFIEMNTRIQVEHGITELVTGVDIVREQIRIASGEPLSLTQADVQFRGHAIECRINAEEGSDFHPVSGRVSEALLPGGPGVRVDSHLYSGYTVPAHYDSLVAKVMVHGRDREEAIARMDRALRETVIAGVPSTVPFLQEVVADDVFQSGNAHTDYVSSRARVIEEQPLAHAGG
ncbi:MAG TPA: acetyl-CoA carboxylase biotin carboxylase subunit [Chloroflexota bacterium]|nr:acetyl-CoA carboxylase biotin carboxylase subunit [Chloroflexota bacterium]